MTNVKLIYNHINGISCAFINGDPVLAQSSLSHYLRMPFHHWYKDILNQIYNVVRDDFTLEFSARQFECFLLKEQQKYCKKCVALNFSAPDVNDKTFQRLGYLKSQVDEIAHEKIQITAYSDEPSPNLARNLVLPALNQLPLCDLNYDLLPLEKLGDEYRPAKEHNLRFIFLYHTLLDTALFQQLSNLSGPTYCFCCGRIPHAPDSPGEVYLNRFAPGREMELLVDWLDYQCLPQCLSKLLEKLPRSPETDEGLTLCMLDQVLFQTFVIPQNRIGFGDRLRLETRCMVEESRVPLEYVSSNPSIISVSGDELIGQGLGISEIEVYSPGYSVPMCRIQLECVRLVSKLKLEVENELLSIGDTTYARVDYFPLDAINADDIRYHSTNTQVLTIDEQTGLITAVGEGFADVVASVGEINARCTVEIRERLMRLLVEPEKASVLIGKEFHFGVTTVPENVIKEAYRYSCSGNGIVEIDESQGVIRGISKGRVDITISNSDGTVDGHMEVNVKKPFDPSILLGAAAVLAAIKLVTFVFQLLFS